MTREQANKAKEITSNIENVEKVLKFLSNSDQIIFSNEDSLFPSRYRLNSNEFNIRLKTVIINTLTTISKELEDELSAL